MSKIRHIFYFFSVSKTNIKCILEYILFLLQKLDSNGPHYIKSNRVCVVLIKKVNSGIAEVKGEMQACIKE